MGWSAKTVVLFGISAVGCQVDLGVPEGVLVDCRSDAQCPQDSICAPGLNQCVPPGTQIEAPELNISFSEPAAGAQDVSVRPTIILVFSANVDTTSLAGRVHLTRVGGSVVALRRNTADVDNVFRYTLDGGGALEGEAAYVLTVDGGVEPAVGELARPLGAAGFSATFQTGPAPDLLAPEPVTNVVVDVRASETQLSWELPSTDAVGVVILRKLGSITTAAPVDGVAYELGDPVEDAEVAVATTLAATTVSVDGSLAYDYVVFARDAALNYASGTRAPFAQAVALQWCTDETGEFSSSSPDATGQQLWLAEAPDQPFANGVLFPASPASLAAPVPLDAVAVDRQYYVRPILSGLGGQRRGQERAFATPSSALPILQQPLEVSAGGTTTMMFDIHGWTAFVAETDDNPVAGVENWVAATVDGDVVSAVLPATGEYRLRVRPTGCGIAPWTVSAAVMVGNFLYVDHGASVGGSGSGPGDALNTLAAAIDVAQQSTESQWEIFVRNGVYEETIRPPTKFGIVVRGSYGDDFYTSDMGVHPTVVRSTTTAPALLGDDALGRGTLEAIAFENTASSPGGYAADITAGQPTLRRCTLVGTLAGLHVGGATTQPSFEDCVLRGTGETHSVAMEVTDEGAPTVHDCIVNGGGGSSESVGLLLANAAGRYDGNDVLGGMGQAAYGVRVLGPTSYDQSRPTLVNNLVLGQGGQLTSRGVQLGDLAIVTNNTLDGGDAEEAVAMGVSGGGVRVANNILFTTGGTERLCYLVTGTGSFQGLFADAFFDCPTAALRHRDGGDIDYALGAPGSFCDEEYTFCPPGLDEYTNALMVSLPGRADAGFLGANDYHLTASSPVSLRLHGEETSTDVCGYECGKGECSCGAVTHDKDGVLRTCPTRATNCFSRGAYELD